MSEGKEVQQPLEARIEEFKKKVEKDIAESGHLNVWEDYWMRIAKKSNDTAEALGIYEAVMGDYSREVSPIAGMVLATENQEVIDELIKRLDPDKSIEHWLDLSIKHPDDEYMFSEAVNEQRKDFEEMQTKVEGEALKILKEKQARFEKTVKELPESGEW